MVADGVSCLISASILLSVMRLEMVRFERSCCRKLAPKES